MLRRKRVEFMKREMNPKTPIDSVSKETTGSDWGFRKGRIVCALIAACLVITMCLFTNAIPLNTVRLHLRTTNASIITETKTDVPVSEHNLTSDQESIAHRMHLAVTVCGDRLEESLVLMKSVTLLTQSPFHIHIFANDDLQKSIIAELDRWRKTFTANMSFTVYPVQFPASVNQNQWKSLFRQCAAQRIFMPDILSTLDAIVYVDSDVLFLRPLDDIWKLFDEFNETQIAGLAPESETPDGNWYLKHPDTPRVSPYGVNTGVFLMNATRMRESNWTTDIVQLFAKHQKVVKLGDQDLANIYFCNNTERLYLLKCHWNYRTDHCAYASNCPSLKTKGAALVHGNRMVFHYDRYPVFRKLYQAFHSLKVGDDAEKHFFQRIVEILLEESQATCSNVTKLLFRQLYQTLLEKRKL